jgi:SAM-dependent methyltransferase
VLPVPADPVLYAGSARYYRRGRAGYSSELPSLLADRLGLDGSGRLVDEGCGPGILTVPLAPLFGEAFGLDPDPAMLSEARRYAGEAGVSNARFIEAAAEDTTSVLAGPFRAVTFGQSFHWTDRQRVAEMVFDLLEPGGALVLVHHTLPADGRAPVPEVAAGSTQPSLPGADPPVPFAEITALRERYLGPVLRAGSGTRNVPAELHPELLARTRFGRPERILLPGRKDITRDIDDVVANVLSQSFSAPRLFGTRLDQFTADLRQLLTASSPTGRFWEWPGDTEVLIARKRTTS